MTRIGTISAQNVLDDVEKFKESATRLNIDRGPIDNVQFFLRSVLHFLQAYDNAEFGPNLHTQARRFKNRAESLYELLESAKKTQGTLEDLRSYNDSLKLFGINHISLRKAEHLTDISLRFLSALNLLNDPSPFQLESFSNHFAESLNRLLQYKGDYI
jgi:hypothetical protein